MTIHRDPIHTRRTWHDYVRLAGAVALVAVVALVTLRFLVEQLRWQIAVVTDTAGQYWWLMPVEWFLWLTAVGATAVVVLAAGRCQSRRWAAAMIVGLFATMLLCACLECDQIALPPPLVAD
jgi:uncharacterized membrane protein YkvI